MDNENQRKILVGYITVISSIFIVFTIRALFIAREFRIARELGSVNHVSYPSELNIFLWNIIPFLIMWIDLIWQHWSLHRRRNKSIDTRPLIIISIVGALFYFDIDTSHSSDGLGILAARILTPILLISGFLLIRSGFPMKDDRLYKR